jgi:FKBP-type peptidyl-prolyl cis-trans isomerase 2
MFNFGGANGKITKVDWENVTIDFNPELAGKDLEFEVTMVEISSNTGSVAPTAAN